MMTQVTPRESAWMKDDVDTKSTVFSSGIAEEQKTAAERAEHENHAEPNHRIVRELPKFNDRLNFWQQRIVNAEATALRIEQQKKEIARDRQIALERRAAHASPSPDAASSVELEEQNSFLRASLKTSRWKAFVNVIRCGSRRQ